MSNVDASGEADDGYMVVEKEVSYAPEDLQKLSRNGLVSLVERQLHLWPSAGRKAKFVRSKTSMATMRRVLLTAHYGFTKIEHVFVPSPVTDGDATNSTPRVGIGDGDAGPSAAANDNRGALEPIERCSMDAMDLGNLSADGEQFVPISILGQSDFSHHEDSVGGLLVPLDLVPSTRAAVNGPALMQVGISTVDPTLFFNAPGTGFADRDVTVGAANSELTMPILQMGPLSMYSPTVGVMRGLQQGLPPSLDLPHFGIGSPTHLGPVDAHSPTLCISPAATISAQQTELDETLLRTKMASVEKRRRADDAGKRAEVAWLKEAARARPGWAEFFKGMNRHLQNPDIVRSWKFAVAFSEEYNKMQSPITARWDKLILKNSIHRALLHGPTWMSEAERMVRILDVYGESGSRPAQEVIEKVRYQTGEGEYPQGSRVLLQWLTKWDEDHE